MAEDVKGLDLEEDDYVTLFTLSKQISLARLPAKQAPTANEMDQVGWTAPHDEEVYHRVLNKVLAMYYVVAYSYERISHSARSRRYPGFERTFT